MKDRTATRFRSWIVFLPAAALACNLIAAGKAQPTLTVVPSLSPTVAATPTEAPTSTPAPTDTVPASTPTPLLGVTVTPPVTPTAPRNCHDDAKFVQDITVPDATEFDAGQAFTKTWRVENTGTCAWAGEYSLVFVSGEQMGGPSAVPIVGEVPPGAFYNLSVNLIAPATSGIYSGQWRLYNVRSGPFGLNDGALTVVIIVR
ncbi:MAG: hypothetical protein HY260_17705 [Chloroflexi bacterium]|nr:hypothetical protein [Chloroflexota bacterium]